ncbi:XrtA/PEP-CTERM system-associated ATPase [Sphingobium aquiterrae]|uniref:XrtA/PEP-CTERM system-associated ATPase n=1 Tax=Sphingobium aquiterrae TaxID=2038656 RepID=UPI003019AF94
MYDQFYGLQGRPFQLTPDPHFYFESATHRKALSYLGYGLAQGEGFIVITGDIGAGKTTLVGHLMETIDPARLTAVKIVSTQVGGDDMLRLAAQNFGIHADGLSKAQLLQRMEAFLHAQARAGRRSLLIVDEGQNLSVSALEELRMLSNFQLGGQALLQIFLLGQPEFRDLLRSPELEQLRQRVIATHHLEPMMDSEIEPYIVHRMTLVGWQGNPAFTADAFAAIHAATGGVPRRVNALTSRVLLLGAIDRLATIDASVVDAVVMDMDGDEAAETKSAPPVALDVAPELPESPVGAPLAIAPEPAFTPEPQPIAAIAPEPPMEEVEPQTQAQPAVSAEAHAALRAEIAELRAVLNAIGNAPPPLDPRIDELAVRLTAIEARADEQDAALRRVLALLIDWVERDDQERAPGHGQVA